MCENLMWYCGFVGLMGRCLCVCSWFVLVCVLVHVGFVSWVPGLFDLVHILLMWVMVLCIGSI